MRLSPLFLSAAALAISMSGVASATEVTGGISINLVGLTIPAGNLVTTTDITFSSVKAGPGSLYFAGITLPQVTLPAPTSTSLDPRLSTDSALDLTFSGLGHFTESSVTFSSGNTTFLNVTMLGNFFPTIAGYTETPFELDLSFTNASMIPLSGSGTLYSLYTSTSTPEPSSLMLLGTGLVGLAGAARRKFAR